MALALMFSGFSTAAHAMKDVRNVVSSDAQSGSLVTDVSTDHAKQDDSKVEKSVCADCLHNCFHIVFLPDNKMKMPEFASADPITEATDFLPDALTTSLLRPPKTLA